MFEVKITATSAEDLEQQLIGLTVLLGIKAPAAAVAAVAAPAAAVVAPEAAPAKVKAVAAKPKAEKPVEEPKVEAEAPKTLDFNTEVAPRVVAVVEAHGKPVVASVLESFAVGRASEIEPSLWPEFLVALDDAVAALA